MSIDRKLCVTEIQRFCMHDGYGIRTTVFLKGCPLRCEWCHNPETQKNHRELLYYESKCISCGACAACSQGVHAFSKGHTLNRSLCRACGSCAEVCPTRALALCGEELTVGEILQAVEKDLAFYAREGGITVSGGEPFLQSEGTLALLRESRARGLSTAVETCGYAETEALLAAVADTDLFLWDVKDTNDARHARYTGVSNRRILENLRAVDRAGGKTRLRCILVNGVNTDAEHYRAVAALACSLSHCEGVEWLSYHAYGGTKSVFLGLAESGRAEWIPTEEQLREAKETVSRAGARVF